MSAHATAGKARATPDKSIIRVRHTDGGGSARTDARIAPSQAPRRTNVGVQLRGATNPPCGGAGRARRAGWSPIDVSVHEVALVRRGRGTPAAQWSLVASYVALGGTVLAGASALAACRRQRVRYGPPRRRALPHPRSAFAPPPDGGRDRSNAPLSAGSSVKGARTPRTAMRAAIAPAGTPRLPRRSIMRRAADISRRGACTAAEDANNGTARVVRVETGGRAVSTPHSRQGGAYSPAVLALQDGR